MYPLIAGIAAGALHVVSGPDHLAAIAPLAVRAPHRGATTGAAWGLGHAAGVIALGALGAVAKSFINVASIASWSEFLVGAALLGIGLWAVRQSRAVVIHTHEHAHGQDAHHDHEHEHVHLHVRTPAHPPSAHKHHTHAAFGVGMLHGAAGTGHLLGVLPSLALPPRQAAVYLVAYGVSAVLSMTAFGYGLGRVGTRLSPTHLRRFMIATGLFAVGLGIAWMISGWTAIA